MPAIQLTDVSKQYGAYHAVTDLNLMVATGEVIGFLGPNGAGKTTTIRLLLGFLRPSAGSVQLLNHDMAVPQAARQARRELGFVPDVAGLDPAVTGIWLLDELARLQRRPPVDRLELIDALELRAQDLKRPMGRLSRGTRQKINIVQGLQHRPDLIILDEPTEGLDPLAKRALFDLLRMAHQRGATIFFSSHVLAEVEELCDRVALDSQRAARDGGAYRRSTGAPAAAGDGTGRRGPGRRRTPIGRAAGGQRAGTEGRALAVLDWGSARGAAAAGDAAGHRRGDRAAFAGGCLFAVLSPGRAGTVRLYVA